MPGHTARLICKIKSRLLQCDRDRGAAM